MITAVEWLIYRIKNQHLYDFSPLDELEKQAKAMEKEQIIDAYYGNIDGVYGYREAGEQYLSLIHI